jgi:hypothetical protein
MTTEEIIRQYAEALNRFTAECMKQGWTILVETDDSGEQIYVHTAPPVQEEKRDA